MLGWCPNFVLKGIVGKNLAIILEKVKGKMIEPIKLTAKRNATKYFIESILEELVMRISRQFDFKILPNTMKPDRKPATMHSKIARTQLKMFYRVVENIIDL